MYEIYLQWETFTHGCWWMSFWHCTHLFVCIHFLYYLKSAWHIQSMPFHISLNSFFQLMIYKVVVGGTQAHSTNSSHKEKFIVQQFIYLISCGPDSVIGLEEKHWQSLYMTTKIHKLNGFSSFFGKPTLGGRLLPWHQNSFSMSTPHHQTINCL